MPAQAHAIGQVFTLPVPLALYLAGAALAVAASFAVSVVVIRPARSTPRYPTWPVPDGLARGASVVLQVLGVVWWLGTILLGYLVDSTSPLPAVLFWIGIWTGLPIAAVVLGNPWPSLSPFRTIFGALERVGRLDRPRARWTPALPIRAASAAGRRPPSCSSPCGRSWCCPRARRRSPSPTSCSATRS